MSAQAGTTYGTRFKFTVAGCAIYAGAGSPEGVQTGTVGDLYVRSDASESNPALYYKATGTATNTGWQTVGGANVAPADATYLVQTADGDLPNAQALGDLATGLVKNTTTTGVQSIAAADVDYIGPTSIIDGVPVQTHLVGVTTFI
jgi:hypothetical protein